MIASGLGEIIDPLTYRLLAAVSTVSTIQQRHYDDQVQTKQTNLLDDFMICRPSSSQVQSYLHSSRFHVFKCS